MNRGLHAGKEGSGTLGGKAGQGESRDAMQLLVLVPPVTFLSLFGHRHFVSRLRSLLCTFSFCRFVSLRAITLLLTLDPLSTPEHSITTIKMGLACGVSAFTASQVAGGMRVPLGDSLDTAGSAETAAMSLTGGFVEMAWTAWTAWCYLGPPCRRPPCRVLQWVQVQAQGMTTLLACIYHVPKYPPVSDVCDEAKDGTDI
jgi:hypothetical protein